jgi:hypothetical protein
VRGWAASENVPVVDIAEWVEAHVPA